MELPVNRIEELYRKTVNLRKEFVAELRSQPLAIDPTAYAFVEGGTVALERGWTLRMIHDAGGVFTQALGFASLTNGKLELSPGFSTLHKDANGAITRVGFDFFGPGDMYMPVFPMFELLKDGVGNWVP